jgi:hypothetical protein
MIFGGTGNLGAVITKGIQANFPEVDIQIISRVHKSSQHGEQYVTAENINIESLKPDLYILNLVNSYYRNPSIDQRDEMKMAIIGTAIKIKKILTQTQANLINFSSYLQNLYLSLPDEQSYYVGLKNQSYELLRDASIKARGTFIDFTLYDNYGGARRTKLFDQIIDCLRIEKPLHILFPHNRINLLSCEDISDSIISYIKASKVEDFDRFEMRSNSDYSILSLVKTIESISGKQSELITYGEMGVSKLLPYVYPRYHSLVENRSVEEYILQRFAISI